MCSVLSEMRSSPVGNCASKALRWGGCGGGEDSKTARAGVLARRGAQLVIVVHRTEACPPDNTDICSL